MTTTSLSDWHEVGEFEIETGPGTSMTVPISVARDAHGSFHVRVADDDASVERIDTPALLVGYFANYGAPYLIDLRNALAGIDGFDEICRMADQQLRHRP
ncbi:MAG: hypothetical protein KA778_17775 [Burkholderiaceae bacterium]|nr:hypothetical protein [Burkholderiaceae bacterium]